MTFFRACPDHLYEVKSVSPRMEMERIMCPEGHACTRWLVMDLKGKVVGIGYRDKPGEMLDGFLDAIVYNEPRKRVEHPSVHRGFPAKCCHGHVGHWRARSDGRRRCMKCRREREKLRRQREGTLPRSHHARIL